MVDVLLYLAVTLGIVVRTGTDQLNRDRAVAVCACCLAVLFALGQVRPDHALYPFDRWAMYGSARPRATVDKFVVENEGGELYDFPFIDIAFSSPRAFMAVLPSLIEKCQCTGGDVVVDEMIDALASIHRDRRGTALTAFRVYEIRLADRQSTLKYQWVPDRTPGAGDR